MNFKNGIILTNNHLRLNFQTCFLFLWGVYEYVSTVLGSRLSYTYDLSNISAAFSWVIFLLLIALSFFKKKYSYKEFIKYCVFLILIFFIELVITSRLFLIYILFILNAQNLDFDRILRFDIKVKIASFCTVVGLSLAGVIENRVMLFYGTTTKSAYGFGHPNTFTIYAIIILMEWLVIRYKKMKIWEWALNFAAGYLIFKIGGGRTSSYAFFGIFCLFVIAKVFPSIYKTKIAYAMFALVTPFAASFTFIAAYLYGQGNEFIIALNDVFTARFSSAWKFLNNYSITLFGQEVKTGSTREELLAGIHSDILDNAYVQCILKYGVVFFAFVIVVYILLKVRLLKIDRPEFALLALFFVLIGITESYMLNPFYNVTLLGLVGFDVFGMSRKEE